MEETLDMYVKLGIYDMHLSFELAKFHFYNQDYRRSYQEFQQLRTKSQYYRDKLGFSQENVLYEGSDPIIFKGILVAMPRLSTRGIVRCYDISTELRDISVRYYDVKYTPDMTELQDYNKKQMTICLPDISTSPINPSSSLAMKYGCQFVAMCFQNFDSNMEYYDLFFDNEGSAFALKPENLRYIPVEIDVPDPPPQSYSYEPRTVSSDYYNFNI